MTTGHHFLFSSKHWLGEGKIKLSLVEEELAFYTKWNLGSSPAGEITALQEVEIHGVPDTMRNNFILTEVTPTNFSIELENTALGTLIGKGIITEDLIAWEFRNAEIGFEGFEFYEKQKDGSYLMRAEYATLDQNRTVIRGRIWEKTDKKS